MHTRQSGLRPGEPELLQWRPVHYHGIRIGMHHAVRSSRRTLLDRTVLQRFGLHSRSKWLRLPVHHRLTAVSAALGALVLGASVTYARTSPPDENIVRELQK